VLALAAPLIGCAAAAAALAHLVQTRAGWLPRRRRVAGAPSVPCGPAERVRRAAAETAAAAAMGGITVALVWWLAPRWAALPSAASLAGASAALIGASAAALAIAWACVGALDGLARHAALGAALRMTAREHRDDERQAGLDPRWRAARGRATELSPRQMMAVAAVLVVADGAAVAIAWDPARRPIPTRLVVGRGAQRAQLVGLARQLRIPIHSEPALATALADRDGPVPAAQWPRLAEVIAAVRARGA
jgi:flagellar biosynthesis protein FlhB